MQRAQAVRERVVQNRSLLSQDAQPCGTGSAGVLSVLYKTGRVCYKIWGLEAVRGR